MENRDYQVASLGYMTNANNFHRIFRSNPLLEENIIRHLHHDVAAAEGNNAALIVHSYVTRYGQYALETDEDQHDEAQRNSLMALASAGDLYAPFPDPTTPEDTVQARETYLKCIRYLMIGGDQVIPRMAVPENVEPVPMGQRDANGEPRPINTVTVGNVAYYIPVTFEEAFNHVQTHLARIKEALDVPDEISFVSSVIVSFCKTGTISDKARGKIETAIALEMGTNVTLLVDLISRFAQTYSRSLTPQTAEIFFTRLYQLIPRHALRLGIVIMQAAEHGITGFLLVKTALEKFPTFDWVIIEAYGPGERVRFLDALREYGGNKYAGFRADLGALKATNFPVLVYTSKQLLLKKDGQRSLAQYRGGARKEIPAITEMINAYTPGAFMVEDGKIVVPEGNQEALQQLAEGRAAWAEAIQAVGRIQN